MQARHARPSMHWEGVHAQSAALMMFCRYVASGPLVRSSYRAGEFFIEAMLERDAASAAAAGK